MLTDRSRKALPFCSSLAIATVLLSAMPAAAQSFQGSGTFNSGSGTITTGTGTTTVNLTSSDAVIDWTTFDTATNPNVPINFQPAGTTATFSSASDFSVLNRILPTDPSRPIQFNGTVLARVAQAAGGTVYFYSPGGIIVGASAIFDVGNLGLTSIAPEVVGGVFEQGSGNEFARFNGPVTAGSAVTIQPGARITGTAPGIGSYLAVVAPRIDQGGSIDGKRVVALVSADAATLTFNPNGLFDIQVASGTSATGTTLFNGGSITGPAGDAGIASRIYMVAVPKNDAITMAIGSGSSLGFAIADAADVDGNAVVLSAGFDIVGGVAGNPSSAGGGAGQARIDVGPVTVTSAIDAKATGRALFFANAGDISNFASNVSIAGAQDTSDPLANAAQFIANGPGAKMNVAGSVTVTALDPKVVAPSSGYLVSNFAVLDAVNGGSITMGGNATVRNNQSSSTPGVNLVTGSARIAVNSGSTIDIAGSAFVSANSLISSSGSATGGNASIDSRGNGAINVGGVTRVHAYGIAGTNNGIGGSGGRGIGGTATLSVESGGDFTTNELNVAADGVGGADAGSGAGAGTGGTARILATGAGSSISIANGNVSGDGSLGELDFVSAEGIGGQASSSGVGGSGIGGTVDVGVFNGATLSGPVTTGTFGLIRIIARGTGGGAGTGATAGGSATGGTINLTVDNATMTSAELLPSAFALGGSALATATGAINGGNAIGGTRNITVRNGGVLTTSLGGGSAGAVGGTATATGRGGDASGGLARLTVDNGTFNVTNRALFFTQNTGGDGGTGGNATGGQVFADILNGGVLNVSLQGPNQLFLVAADNRGGNSFSAPGTTGGNATGGLAQLSVANGTLTSANIAVSAVGIGGGGQVTQGGAGTGGSARFQMRGGTVSGTVLQVDATGTGGAIDAMFSGNGGAGAGGFATLEATSGTTSVSFSSVEVRSDGLGGAATGTTGNGGAAVGGNAQLFGTGGASLTVNAPTVTVHAVGAGGSAGTSAGDGGSATAGAARVVVNNAAVTVGGDLGINGGVRGGDGINGGAGLANPNATVANAFIGVNNGSLAVTGVTHLDADVFGGDGSQSGNGGNAGGGFALVFAGDNNGTGLRGTINLQDVLVGANSIGGSAFGTGDGGDAAAGRAHIFVNGGDIAIAGNADIAAIAIGGAGLNGGDAISPQPFRVPRALIGSFNGTVQVGGSATFSAAAFGGNASEIGGGQGGIAFAGQAGIDAQSQNGPSAVTVGDLLIDVSASGGSGGAGLSGQAGGAGGDAYGGVAFAFGNAGRGVLTVTGDTLITADAFGGSGGQGGSGGTTAPGGDGGAGGRAIGGGFSLGTISGADTTENTGSASFGLVTALSQAFGGPGGGGGSGTVQGNGGSGGTGFGGFGGVLVRGSPATFGDVIFDVSGTGGDGGTGAVAGNGGDGYAGDLSVTVTQRFNRTERGSLTAGNLSLFAGGFGGSGAVAGRSFYSAAAGSEQGFFVRQSDVTLANLAMGTIGDLAPNITTTVLQVQDETTGIPVPTQVTVAPSPLDIAIAQSTVNVAGHFSVTTPGQMTVSLDASTVNAGTLTLHAGNFVLPAARPATLGTFNVGSAPSIVTGLDFLAYANFAFPGGLLLHLDGSILTGSISTDGGIEFLAAGSIATDALTGAGVTLDAGTTLATGAVVSGHTIDLTAGGTITTGALTSGDSVFVDAGGVLTTGSVSAGLVNPVSFPADGYRIGLRSQVGITAGDLSAAAAIGVSSPGAIAVGNVNAPQLFLALPGASLTTGSITTATTGQIYIANHSMEALGGPIGETFDPSPIVAAQPVPVAGPVTIAGQISAGTLRGASTGLFQTNTIGATSVRLSGDAGVSVLSTTAGQSIDLRSSAGAVRSDNLNAGDSVFIGAASGVTINGTVQAGVVNPNTSSGAQYKVAIAGGSGAVSTGAISAARDLGIQTSGAITTGNLAGRDVLLLAGGSLTTGSITAPSGAIYFGNASAANSTNNVFQPFRGEGGLLPIFNTAPAAIGGSVTFGGAIQGGSLLGAGQGTLSAQAISTSGFIDLSVVGLATVNGAWRSPRIDLVSGDIAITQTGSLDALSSTGEILLATNNAAGVFVGDGLSSSPAGYVLDNVEFSRLKAGEIAIVGVDTAQATDMTVGNLTVTGSQLYGADGTLILATGDRTTETPAGILHVSGAISGTGFASTNELALLSGTVEIEAVHGSVKLANDSGGLGGLVFIEADHVHVASSEILTKLRADPLYAGHITDINTPLAVARPDGVLNALGIEVFPGRTFYVQNTGTVSTPAGFLTTFENSEVAAPDQPPPGGIEVVINGQFQTSTGPVSGRAAFALVQGDTTPDEEQFAGFSSTSQLNGCLFLGGVCATGADPISAVSSTISVVVTQVLADAPSAPAAASADESEENSADEPESQDESDTGSSPIAPPAPLVNTRPLNPDADVSEPVSGAGNPALLGSAVNEDSAEGGSQ